MIRYRQLRILVVALSLLLPAGTAMAADIYRWVDDEGGVHFTQNPPTDRPSERLETAPPPADPPEQNRERFEEMTRGFEDRVESRRERRRQQAQTEAEEERLAERCTGWRAKRDKLASSRQLRDSSNDYRVLSERQRRDLLAEYQDLIDQWCNGPN